ncbi:hypothetical protein ARMGADRAFT_183522 [Armillaria gallica]|uniref:Uncharacterized protein n=1 Tax=Armillaria gallica TaxID=47427 RepID=A0A2H3DXT2_ARMGA|nr:hypothetical protein ARMGADRAFT_183522 [Armillaria gallica]
MHYGFRADVSLILRWCLQSIPFNGNLPPVIDCITNRICVLMQTQPIAQYLSSVFLYDWPRYPLDLQSTCLPLLCAAAALIRRSTPVTHISYTAQSLQIFNIVVRRWDRDLIILAATHFIPGVYIRYSHRCRICYLPSLCVYASCSYVNIFLHVLERALRLCLFARLLRIQVRYGMGMTERNRRNWRLDERFAARRFA